jgi:coiled-coil domain-containing protein 12
MEEAAARRERLKALKAAQQLLEADAGAASAAQQEAAAAEPERPVLKFRNYTVKDEQHIQHEKVNVNLPCIQRIAVEPSGP